MGNSLYMNNPAGNTYYDEQSLILSEVKQMERIQAKIEDEKYIELYSPKDYFYRAPRINNKIEREKIKIEPPPPKKQDDNMPLFLTLGSTLCMGVISLVTIISMLSGIANGTSSLRNNILSIFSAVAMLISMLLIPLMTTKWQKKRDKNYEITL